MSQLSLFKISRPRAQLLKWVGNKFKYALEIVSFFPEEYNDFIEPFVGTGAILGTLAPPKAIAGDILSPLIDLWHLVQNSPEKLIEHYTKEITRFNLDRLYTYEQIRDRYNNNSNPLDLLILSRTCYGGVMRFTKEGKISTPIGPHKPISPSAFVSRVNEWRDRIINTTFINQSFEKTMRYAAEGDLVYCDPPYIDTQSILYGSQEFSFSRLINSISECKEKGAKVALSIDGSKKSGLKKIELKIPRDLFVREIFLDCGSSMLRRFQNGGKIMIGEDVRDRLLLTW